MARRRMIDPNFWQSEDISRLSQLARLLFVGMISNADDEGRGRANPNYLKSIIFPYDDIRVVEVDKALSEISHNTSVAVYEVAHSTYYAFTNWKKWQRVDKPQSSIIPPFEASEQDQLENSPELVGNDSGISRESVGNDSCLKEEKGKEEKRKEENTRGSASFRKPSVAEIHAYCQERKNMVDAQQFYDFYESKGWKVGNQPMKEWRAAVRTWQRRQTAAQQQKSVADKKGFSQREYSREEREKREIDNYAELEAIYGDKK